MARPFSDHFVIARAFFCARLWRARSRSDQKTVWPRETNRVPHVHVPGSDRPALKLLNKHVVKQISSKWHDLGLELLEQEDEETLNQIKSDNPKDVNECCKEMFQLWLRKCSTATWHQLIQALKVVDLTTLATNVEGMLIPLKTAVSEGMLMYIFLGSIQFVGFQLLRKPSYLVPYLVYHPYICSFFK